MAMSSRQDLPYLQGRKFHHPQRLLLLLQRETPPGLIMLMQILTRMGQSVKENLLLVENLLPPRGGGLLFLEELDLQEDQILLADVQILLSVAD